jgi:nitrite reductase (NADH) small subunit
MSGANHSTEPSAPSTPLCKLGPLDRVPPGEGKAFDIGDRRVAVFRTRGGELYATQAACPHKGGPLADGIVGGGTVICPLHAYKYDLKSGQPLGNGCPALQTYRVELGMDGEMLLFTEPP